MTKIINEKENEDVKPKYSLERKKAKIDVSGRKKKSAIEDKLKKLKNKKSDTQIFEDDSKSIEITSSKESGTSITEKSKGKRSFSTKFVKRKKKNPSTNENENGNKFVMRDNNATVFVGNLPIKTNRKDVANFFEAYGPIISIQLRTCDGKLILKHSARKESGSLIAFVQLKDHQTAKKALNLNGCFMKTNCIRVTMADISEIKNDKDYRKRSVFVGNLNNKTINDEKLRETFSSCGEVEYVRTFPNKQMGCAFVCFKKPESVGLALELKDTVVDGRPIRVDRYKLNMPGKGEQKSGKDGPKASGSSTNVKENSIMILDLSDATSAEQIKEKFGKYGQIEKVEIINQNNKVSAIVQYKNRHSVTLATKLTFVMLNMKCSRVVPCIRKQEQSAKFTVKKNAFRGRTTDFQRKKGKLTKKKSNSQLEKFARIIAMKGKA